MKRNPMVPVAIVAGALIIGAPTVAAAASLIDSSDIKNESVRSIDLGPNSVRASEVRAGAVGTSEIRSQSVQSVDLAADSVGSSEVRSGAVGGSEIANGAVGLDDLSQEAVDSMQVAPVYETFQANVAKIGGSFATNATVAGTLELEPGTYMITTDALFRSNQPASGSTTLQVAVRAEDGSEWGMDLGTGFTGASPSQAEREVTTSTTRVVTVEGESAVPVTVSVFGYENDGQGSADSGKFDAEVYLTAVPVK